GHLPVAIGVGGAVVIEGDSEVGKVPLVGRLDAGDEVFRRGARLLRGQHDGRAVGVVCAHVPGGAAGHAPCPHPDIGLDVADPVAQVRGAVGAGPGGGGVGR